MSSPTGVHVERRTGPRQERERDRRAPRPRIAELPDQTPATSVASADESRRLAITYHRRRRKAATLKSALDDIPGVGPSRRTALLTAFGSVDGVRAAPTEALATAAGIGPALAESIKQALS